MNLQALHQREDFMRQLGLHLWDSYVRYEIVEASYLAVFSAHHDGGLFNLVSRPCSLAAAKHIFVAATGLGIASVNALLNERCMWPRSCHAADQSCYSRIFPDRLLPFFTP